MKAFFPFFKYLKPHRVKLVWAILFGLVGGISSGAGLPTILKYVLGDAFVTGPNRPSLEHVAWLASLIPLIFILRGFFNFSSGMLSTRVAVEFSKALQQDLFDHLQAMPLSFFDSHQRGDLQTRLTRDTLLVQNAVLDTVPVLLTLPFQAVVAFGTLVWALVQYDEIGFLISFIIVAPMCLIPVYLIRRNVRRRSHEWTRHASIIAQHLWENFNGIHEIRSFNLEEAQKQGFKTKLNAYLKEQYKIKKYLLLQQPSMEIIIGVAIAAVVVYAFSRGVSFATLSALVALLYFTFDPIKRIGQSFNQINQCEPNAERLIEFFMTVPAIVDPPSPRKLEHVRGDISFENVTFAYGDAPALTRVSTVIPAGCNCALVGPSGAGKSTFAKLIPRFYEVGSGCITLDGVDIRDVRQADLRRHIAVVSQHPVLFDLSIMENIRLGRPDATDEAVFDAARRAHADTFIRAFDEGYATPAGDRGDRLSGGQKQRIAIARAFLKNAPVLLLDEATSALDSESEQAVQAALADLAKGRTLVTIAHRLSTIRNSALILVFDHGRLIARGTHQELMQTSPSYQNLVNIQIGGVTLPPFSPAQ